MVFIVHDASGTRAAQIAALVEACGACPLLLPDPRTLLRLQRSPNQFGAIVTIDADGDAEPALAAIRHLAGLGLGVVAIEHGAAPASLRARCRALLAGARHLLRSGDGAFEPALRQTLRELIDALTEKTGEDERRRRLFAGLGLVGAGEAMLAIFRRIERISQFSDLPALILGESGTGKELAARAIHRLDAKRRDRPFIAVNCAAISPALAESELFGHRRGAYTGADRDRRGLFRAANGGVLFLDEIGELGLELQAKLLRVIQEGRVLGVGEEHEAVVDLRIIAATNADLRRMVDEKRFREDLYHRLKLLPVELPPLRERREDIGLLVEHFLARHAGPGPGVSAGSDYIEALASLALPGNVRELENLVRSTLVESSGCSKLGLGHLPAEIWNTLGAEAGEPASGELQGTSADGMAGADMRDAAKSFVALAAGGALSLSQSLACCEKLLIEAALARSQHNQARAARLLGITPRSVYNKLRRHHIQA